MNIFKKIKIFYKVWRMVLKLKEAVMGKGILTTEFWMAILSQGVPIVLALWGFIPQDVMIKIMAIGGVLAGVYALARSIVKATATKKDDAIFNTIIKIIKPLAEKLGIKVEQLPKP